MNETVVRLRDGLNDHDPEAVAALFAPDYRSEQPVHPTGARRRHRGRRAAAGQAVRMNP